jgi:hypothetical protein
MRIRIVKSPPVASIDGIQMDGFVVGQQYEVGNSVGALFLAEGWAEPVALDAPKPFLPFGGDDPFDSRTLYPEQPSNLSRDATPPFFERDLAGDFMWRRSKPRPRKS